ncbi:hypothetical protein BB559_001070 [Furculomyces boomerangus]|uniref:Protein YOP1 n=2 Tax=Harpellales TaxID=61421 RepID=A0A2T9Z342_9FUNG|nr:hypothetical protein BB559_001070 [Furculomyces boomerangus]PWA00311.1 hypothetical protein BB558_003628 [Smittium angustum]
MYASYKTFMKLNVIGTKKSPLEEFLIAFSQGASSKNVNTMEEIQFYIKYWTVMAWFTAAEFVADFFLCIIPFYGVFKLIFVLWMVLPQTKGAIFLFDIYIHPLMIQNEGTLDYYLLQTQNFSQQQNVTPGYGSSIFSNVISGSDRLIKNLLSKNPVATPSSSGFNKNNPTNYNNSSQTLGSTLSAIGKVGEALLKSQQTGTNSSASTSNYNNYGTQSYSDRSLPKNMEFPTPKFDTDDNNLNSNFMEEANNLFNPDSDTGEAFVSVDNVQYENVQNKPDDGSGLRRRWFLW